MPRRLLATLLTLALALALAASPAGSAPKLTVLAAASLTNAFPAFDANESYSFAGSDALAAQIRLGAPADVFAAASPVAPQALYSAGIVSKPVTFATNRLVVVVPKGNPGGIHSIFDLTRPGKRIVIGTPTVPIGAYTRQVLRNMGLLTRVLPNVVDQEKDVNGVLAKVALGVADAGFVYVTDRLAASGQVSGIPIPSWAQPPVQYQIAVVSSSTNKTAAQAYIKRLLSTTGRQILLKYGFGVPKLPATTTK
jgi:molybdate transport system substrate-binding protein